MGLKICSFASGSRGNCIYVSSETTSVIVDAGISVRRISQDLAAVDASAPAGVIVTHAHADHIGNLQSIAKKFSPVIYAHYLTAPALASILPGYLKIKEFDGDFFVGDITVSPFRVSHDVPCVGMSFLCDGSKISIMTDVGRVTDANLRHVDGSDVVLIESNHDENMLLGNPHYSAALKRRILSDRGHLSNKMCAEAAARFARTGAKRIILGHLSKENNTPELAYNTTKDELDREGLSVALSLALQDSMSDLIEVSA